MHQCLASGTDDSPVGDDRHLKSASDHDLMTRRPLGQLCALLGAMQAQSDGSVSTMGRWKPTH